MRTALGIGIFLGFFGLLHAQKPFKQYPSLEHTGYRLPPDWNRPAEWVFARLRYPDIYRGAYGESLYWSMDYPAGDRHLAQGIRRLTRLDVRSVEQVVDLDGSDDVYNWPFLYGVEVGMWDLTPEEAAQLRDYLLRGGFLMVDDFHGPPEWQNFERGMQMVFPDRDIVDLTAKDTIFKVFTDIDRLQQIPSAQYINTGVTWEKNGFTPHFRGIRDSKGRLMVVINHNMDLGDAIEWSDDPRYPEKFASLAYRTITNYVIYNLTH